MTKRKSEKSAQACIFSPCFVAATGLKELLSAQGFDTRVVLLSELQAGSEPSQSKDVKEECGLYVFYIPRESFYFLITLMEIARRINEKKADVDFVFVSSVSCSWLHRNILQMPGGESFTFNARITSSRLSVNRLGQYFQRIKLNLPFISRDTYMINKGGDGNVGLTPRETEVLLELFSYTGTMIVSKNKCVASKTLYNQRKSGLRKMVENSAELAGKLPGASKRWKARLAQKEMSGYEKDFVTGIEMQEVYQIYQPIINISREICGFEILTRWRQKGYVISPDEFIPGLKSESVLLLLTAMSLKNAIDGINRYGGKCFFSINIHPDLNSCPGLVKMCIEACRQLNDSRWKSQLVLEFSEKSDFHKSPDIIDVLKSISQLGVTVYLDDCFSEGSVFFPVRKYSFDGYKLDKSIVDNILTSKEDMALITSLAGYCSMTGRHCIAEGVEDMFTFEKLKKLGIELFQGYLFYKPVSITDLTSLIQGAKCADRLKHTDIS
ncbi:TPA: EAL domain-containing protein [Klebsiella oxytoca]|uniref:EAL domain-containing protein n=1 Tax=Klebsiella oxytoca TaxID=571 RepID=UPI00109216A0|nr:EAL domain-containing protein [Klebsiella oxytoca]EJG2192155.1 EAL domain-containing protein [Klebsiella oxytoca]TGN43056.1 EAL domain-containing protein [Klebsiella oxytoca]WKM72490.1 EAL domain-containing protein [Klebsiella oxytoca]HEC2079986.1 EAL domain-containing protein [Klebsiella oxytoca]HEF4889744.1 EAL domain-containing protein [Klebsiella oxytoca]